MSTPSPVPSLETAPPFPVSAAALDYQSITHSEQTMTAPRTYQSAWQWNDDQTAKLMTAEEWLEEEASVDAKLTVEGEDDGGPNRGGIMLAIAKEIATLRVERSQWADECTRRAQEQLRAGVSERAEPSTPSQIQTNPNLGVGSTEPPCSICGLDKSAHQGIQSFCPIFATYRAALPSPERSPAPEPETPSFTQGDVKNLEAIGVHGATVYDWTLWARDLAQRIAALLPPVQ